MTSEDYKYDGRKILARYLIALGVVDFFRIYYGMGLVAKLVYMIFENSDNAFGITLFLSNLVMYLCFLAVLIFFYKKIISSEDREAIILYYLWAGIFVLLPLINLLILGAVEKSALQNQIMTVEFDYALGWATNVLIITVHIICMILTGCYLRQLRHIAAAILLSAIYFIGWKSSLMSLNTDITLYNNIKLGTVVLTGLMLLNPNQYINNKYLRKSRLERGNL